MNKVKKKKKDLECNILIEEKNKKKKKIPRYLFSDFLFHNKSRAIGYLQSCTTRFRVLLEPFAFITLRKVSFTHLDLSVCSAYIPSSSKYSLCVRS